VSKSARTMRIKSTSFCRSAGTKHNCMKAIRNRIEIADLCGGGILMKLSSCS